MKKIITLILIVSFFTHNYIANAQPSDNEDVMLKGLMLDFGGGSDGLSMAFGFRYWLASLSIGVVGFANKIPKYSNVPPVGVNLNPSQPLPNGFVEEKHTGIIVTFDGAIHYEMFPWNFFGSIGYYTQQDSVLAKQVNTTGQILGRYSYKVENSQGIAFGAGANYYLSDNIGVGIGLHTKRGVYAQFVYVWE
ncbi:MAG: hypothetical protein N3A67_02480 [Ignavibacteria bacterium]|nr:hypothetical protein [Ignavibacteria bacterium]